MRDTVLSLPLSDLMRGFHNSRLYLNPELHRDEQRHSKQLPSSSPNLKTPGGSWRSVGPSDHHQLTYSQRGVGAACAKAALRAACKLRVSCV